MDDLTADSWDTDEGRDEGTRYPDVVKERAYQLWAFKCGGDATKVSAALKEDKPPVKVDPHRIRDWARRYEWPMRRYQDWQQIAPDLIRTLGIDLTFGLLETAAEMRRIVTSNKMLTIETVTPMGSQHTEEVPEIATKDRIAAGKWIGENYARLRELGVHNDAPPLTEGSANGGDALDMSPEAALERIRRRREEGKQ